MCLSLSNYWIVPRLFFTTVEGERHTCSVLEKVSITRVLAGVSLTLYYGSSSERNTDGRRLL
jgi:hypothetical protein